MGVGKFGFGEEGPGGQVDDAAHGLDAAGELLAGVGSHLFHLLAKLKADLLVAAAVRLVKTNSSGWINENRKIQGRFEWQAGYFGVSVSESRVAEVRHYIQTQQEHHARLSFRDELIKLLERNRIPFDEKYLLG
ncbi:MAG TPA: transposase [Thermoanaerobaculia bacterium]|nr:transposase [Thermoanaerobaculia bacterium]